MRRGPRPTCMSRQGARAPTSPCDSQHSESGRPRGLPHGATLGEICQRVRRLARMKTRAAREPSARLQRDACRRQPFRRGDRSHPGRQAGLARAGPVVADRPDQPQADDHRHQQAQDRDLVGAVPERVEQQEDDVGRRAAGRRPATPCRPARTTRRTRRAAPVARAGPSGRGRRPGPRRARMPRIAPATRNGTSPAGPNPIATPPSTSPTAHEISIPRGRLFSPGAGSSAGSNTRSAGKQNRLNRPVSRQQVALWVSRTRYLTPAMVTSWPGFINFLTGSKLTLKKSPMLRPSYKGGLCQVYQTLPFPPGEA